MFFIAFSIKVQQNQTGNLISNYTPARKRAMTMVSRAIRCPTLCFYHTTQSNTAASRFGSAAFWPFSSLIPVLRYIFPSSTTHHTQGKDAATARAGYLPVGYLPAFHARCFS